MALTLAFPVALGITGFCLLERYQKIALWIRRVIRLMAGIPTVVYGIAAVFLLVPLLRETFRSGSGFCLLAAGCHGSTIDFARYGNDVRHSLPSAGKPDPPGFCIHGFYRYANSFIPGPAQRGQSDGHRRALLGFSRAIGDTLLPLMLAGNAPQLAGSVFDSGPHLNRPYWPGSGYGKWQCGL